MAESFFFYSDVAMVSLVFGFLIKFFDQNGILNFKILQHVPVVSNSLQFLVLFNFWINSIELQLQSFSYIYYDRLPILLSNLIST